MKPRSNLITILGWVHNPKRRAHRFRCQGCARIIADGSDIIIERRGGSSHGYHQRCFTSMAGHAAALRDQEHLNGQQP